MTRVLTALTVSIILFGADVSSAQTQPRPYIADVSPKAVAPGAGSFTLAVRGTGLVDGVSQIYWNGTPLAGTTCTAAASPNMASCSATVPASNVAVPGVANISVANPGATLPIVSNAVPLPINVAIRPIFCADWDTNCPVRITDIASNPEHIATGDFNGDGRVDVAMFYYFNSTVSLKFGDGNGGFTEGVPLQSTNPITQIVAADLDEDGVVDIAALGGGRLTIFHGNGDGTFTEGTIVAVGTNTNHRGFVAADFNSDGHLDLATLTTTPTFGVLGIQLILGDGHGGFVKAGTFGTFDIPATGVGNAAMVAGDFDSDGVLDILTVFNPGVALLAKGNGSGGFTAGWTYSFGNNPFGDQVDAGDLNGDGHLDFAVVNSFDNLFRVFLGDGQGNFTLTPASPLTNGLTNNRSLRILDVDGDGKLDLVSLTRDFYGNNGVISVFYGDGAGGFTSATAHEYLSRYSTDFGLTDLNGDGRLDLVSSATFTASTGRFTSVLQYPVSSMSPSSMDFGNQRYLTPSAPRTVTVSASGTAPLTLSTISNSLTDYDVTGGTCAVGVPIAPGSQCTIEVTFTPQAAGNRYGTLSVIGNAYQRPGGVEHLAYFGGSDYPRSEETYSGLGQVVIGAEHIMPVVLRNTGIGPFNLTFDWASQTSLGNISLDSGNCPVSPTFLVPDASCTYYVHVTPAIRGAFSMQWMVWDHPPGRQQYGIASNDARGTGYSGAAIASAATLAFAAQAVNTSSALRSVTFTNTAASPLYIYGISAQSFPTSDFAIANTSTCGATLAASSSCRVDVIFTPTTKGLREATLGFDTSALVPFAYVALSGTGVANPLPFISAPLSPSAIVPGSASGVPLVVRGAGFVAGSVVRLNGTALTTTFVDVTELQATIPAAQIATARTARVTVFNPSPGGGESNPAELPIATSTDSPSFVRHDATVGTAPEAVATGDFNADGFPDIAVSNCGSERGNETPCASAEIVILLGSPTGDVAAPISIPVSGSTADDIVSGDFTGDGKLDLVVSHWFSASITLLKGDGAGHFAPSSDSPISLSWWSGACSIGPLSSGDFNGDGSLDLVALDPWCEQLIVFPGSAGTISGIPIGYTSPGTVQDIAVGDFNGDGNLDIVAPMNYYGLFIATGDGAGNLDWVDPIPGLKGTGGFVVADFNGDGKSDIAIVDTASVGIFLGDGAAGFSPAGSVATGGAARSMTVADMNNDGAVDLIVANSDDDTVVILLGDGAGHFAPPGAAESVGARPVAVASVDVDGDGRLDLITVNQADGTITVLRQENPALGTTTTITSQSPNPAAPGQAVTMGFIVASVVTPQGSVTLTASTGESCTGSLSGGQGSCSMTFATTGPRTIVASYAGNGNHTASASAPVTQTVNGPIASLTPASADFGTVYLDDKATRTFTLKNTGNVLLRVIDVAIVAPGNAIADFTRKPPACPASLAPGASCAITIQFDPRAIGVRTATLRVTDNATGSPHTAALIATVVNPKASLAPGKVEFGRQKVGTVSAIKTVTLTNIGTTALTVGTIGVTGDFALEAGTTCASATALAPAASCKINLTFRPAAKGDRNGSLTVTSTAKNSPQIVTLSGGGS